MPLTLARKLNIREGDTLFLIDAPANFRRSLGTLPAGTKIVSNAANAVQLHWFVKHRAQMEANLQRVLSLLTEDKTLWIYYPKATSKIQTDLTRDHGWDAFQKFKHLQRLTLISFDETWSAFACRLAKESDIAKKAKPNVRAIFDWIDSEKKIVRLPDDFNAALIKHKNEQTFFNTLSFTNRKEYVEWIITAKKPETRAERVQGTIERLGKGWKNPRNI